MELQAEARRLFQNDEELLEAVRALSVRERRSKDEVTAELLSQALVQRDKDEIYLLRWKSLTNREQQVTALTCLNYTNRQIGIRLGISTNTVATHVRNALYKFDLHSKDELRLALAGWDFSAWENIH